MEMVEVRVVITMVTPGGQILKDESTDTNIEPDVKGIESTLEVAKKYGIIKSYQVEVI